MKYDLNELWDRIINKKEMGHKCKNDIYVIPNLRLKSKL